jgi:tetratricopeptide (TPR) repeat protein
MEPSFLEKGIQQARQGDDSGAIATFSQAIALTPQAEAYYRRGLSHFKLGNLHAAVFDYTAALNQDGDRLEFYYARALGRIELRNFSGALEDVQAAIRRHPNHAPLYQLKGTIEQKLVMRQAAIASFKTAANLYLSAKDSDSCRLCLQKIEQLQPSPPPSQSELPPIAMLSHAQLLANILKRAEMGNCAQALQDLDWALRADPQDATVYCCRAIVKSKMGDKQGAIADLNQAVYLNPQDAIALRNRGKLRLQIGDFLGAKTDLNQALQVNPKDAMSYVGRGEIESAMGNYQDALIDFSLAIKLQPDYPEAYLSRAQAYAHQEEMQQAICDRQVAASQFCARQDWKNYHKTISLLKSFQSPIASENPSVSSNFAFLHPYEPQLATLATLAEKYCTDDPVTCLMKLRQFGELFAQSVAKKVALSPILDETQLDLLNRLYGAGYLPEEIHHKLQDIRRIGNQAAHDYRGEHSIALKHLKSAWELSIWLCRQFGDDSFSTPNSFVPPTSS